MVYAIYLVDTGKLLNLVRTEPTNLDTEFGFIEVTDEDAIDSDTQVVLNNVLTTKPAFPSTFDKHEILADKTDRATMLNIPADTSYSITPNTRTNHVDARTGTVDGSIIEFLSDILGEFQIQLTNPSTLPFTTTITVKDFPRV